MRRWIAPPLLSYNKKKTFGSTSILPHAKNPIFNENRIIEQQFRYFLMPIQKQYKYYCTKTCKLIIYIILKFAKNI